MNRQGQGGRGRPIQMGGHGSQRETGAKPRRTVGEGAPSHPVRSDQGGQQAGPARPAITQRPRGSRASLVEGRFASTAPQVQPVPTGAIPKNRAPHKKQLREESAGEGGVGEICKTLAAVALQQPANPRKPSFKPLSRTGEYKKGDLGCKVSLEANLYSVNIPEKLEVFHYDVATSPERKGIALRNVIKAFLAAKQFPFHGRVIAYIGGKSFYTRRAIPGLVSAREFQFFYNEPDEDPSRGREYVITIKPTGPCCVSFEKLHDYLKNGSSSDRPMEQLQVLDIIMKQFSSARPNVTMIRDSFFTPPGDCIVNLSPGVAMWSGHFQSVRPVGWKIVFNLDTAYKALVKEQYVHEWLREIYGERALQLAGLPSYQKEQFAKQISRLRVCYQTKWLIKKMVRGLAGPANRETFSVKKMVDGKEVEENTTVQAYVASEYGIELSYPHLPCVWMATTLPDRRILVPMEICKILPNQHVPGKLTDQQVRVLIKETGLKPSERQKKINKIRQDLPTNEDQLLKEFGICIDMQMLKLEGRVLDAPPLTYDGGRSAQPKDGKWDMRYKMFYEGSSMDQWGVLYIEGDDPRNRDVTFNKLDRFVAQFKRIGAGLGVRVGHPLQRDCSPTADSVTGAMRSIRKEAKDLKLLLVITRSQSDPLYKTVKTVGDTELHLTTQCVRRDNVRAPKDQVLSNIFLKVNPKLGGINLLISNNVRPWILNNPKEQVMIMGADVTHPGGQQRPSIAAVVASLDPNAFRYAVEISVQEPRQEMIADMKEMVVKLLRKFHRANCSTSTGKPTKIIFYRDGVSEGQFEQVLNEELRAIQGACFAVGGPHYRPAITFIVVQKRHHVRFFRTGADVGEQIEPGTVVDTEVTHPTEFDFYLNSHMAIKGTSRPAHYHLLYDDSNFTANQVEELTYQLCHVFSRCTRSVSYPAPCYYAHLVAERGSCYYDQLVPAGQPYVSSMAPNLQEKINGISETNPMFFV